MKLRSTLGSVTALLLVGVFYTFAFCMIEDVDENAISVEYYYSTETEYAELEAKESVYDETFTSYAASDAELKITEDETDDVPEQTINDESEMTQEEYTQVTTAVPEEKVSEIPQTKGESVTEAQSEYEYPEDFDVDDFSDKSSEAEEQSVFADGNQENQVIMNSDDEENAETVVTEATEVTEITEITKVTTVPVFDFEEETVPVVTEKESDETIKVIENVPEISGDIIITIIDESQVTSQDTFVSVNVGGSADISPDETFTAKFNGSVQTVNAFDLICGIVYNEISTSFSNEAIKAQAVAAYSYVKYHNVNGLTPSVLVKANPPEKIKRLVSEVWGVCCYYNGNVAQTVYMASSSGYTADSKNVWGGSVPYLKSVYCPFDAQYDPNYGYKMKVSEDNMRALIEKALGITLSGNPSDWITITEYVDGNYVSKVNIDSQKIISGRTMRENIMGYKLKSTAFEVSYSDGYFIFTTYGYGHGVGMSQNGANILAKQGYSYDEILKFYFTGIEVL